MVCDFCGGEHPEDDLICLMAREDWRARRTFFTAANSGPKTYDFSHLTGGFEDATVPTSAPGDRAS